MDPAFLHRMGLRRFHTGASAANSRRSRECCITVRRAVFLFSQSKRYARIVQFGSGGDFRPLHRRTFPASLRQGSAVVPMISLK